jgi:hypothetical protein
MYTSVYNLLLHTSKGKSIELDALSESQSDRESDTRSPEIDNFLGYALIAGFETIFFTAIASLPWTMLLQDHHQHGYPFQEGMCWISYFSQRNSPIFRL